jgi:hypothetical protein
MARKKKIKKVQDMTVQQLFGIRLNTPAPKIIIPKTAYKRKQKHKKNWNE